MTKGVIFNYDWCTYDGVAILGNGRFYFLQTPSMSKNIVASIDDILEGQPVVFSTDEKGLAVGISLDQGRIPGEPLRGRMIQKKLTTDGILKTDKDALMPNLFVAYKEEPGFDLNEAAKLEFRLHVQDGRLVAGDISHVVGKNIGIIHSYAKMDGAGSNGLGWIIGSNNAAIRFYDSDVCTADIKHGMLAHYDISEIGHHGSGHAENITVERLPGHIYHGIVFTNKKLGRNARCIRDVVDGTVYCDGNIPRFKHGTLVSYRLERQKAVDISAESVLPFSKSKGIVISKDRMYPKVTIEDTQGERLFAYSVHFIYTDPMNGCRPIEFDKVEEGSYVMFDRLQTTSGRTMATRVLPYR